MKQLFHIVLVMLFAVSCASKSKVLKEIDMDAPHEGHLFKLDKSIIEVAEVPTKRMKFYFYTLDENKKLVPMPIQDITLKDGIIDPSTTKQNFGIIFIEHKTYIEGIVEHFKLDHDEDHRVNVDVKIGSKRRNISIPMTHH